MATRIPDAFIDDLIARTDIVELIQARVALKRKGKEYSACCPFHDERTPSFTVSPTKQFYYCFGCGAHGNALRFLMDYERLEFLDALEELAKRAGVEIPRDTRQRHQSHDHQALFDVLGEAARLFRQQLETAPKAQQYLERRGVDARVRAQFDLGYAPDAFGSVRDALGSTPQRLALLERAGLLAKNARGVYDKFRHRVMFPIHDRRGRVIAFGGRALAADGGGPKYLNSPETALFHKGRELYGLWQARQAQSTLERLIVVEGYMDVIALFQHGLTQAVATLGTATTPEQAELLFRSAPDVVFCFDGDRAGRAAAWKALNAVLAHLRDGRQAWFLFLPEGEDPDSLIRREGAAGFDARLRAATPLSDYFFEQLSEGAPLSTLDGRARLAERARPLLAKLPDGAFADLMRQRLGEITGLAPRAAAPLPPPRRTAQPRGAAPRKRSIVRSAITLLLQQPALALEVLPPYRFAALRQPGIALLIELLALAQSRPGISTGAVLEAFAEHAEHPALRRLAAVPVPGEAAQWQAEFLGSIAQLERQTLNQRIVELQHKQREGELDFEQKAELRDALLAARRNG